jgi:hypothetical protein
MNPNPQTISVKCLCALVLAGMLAGCNDGPRHAASQDRAKLAANSAHASPQDAAADDPRARFSRGFQNR